MSGKAKGPRGGGTIVIRREEGGEAGHHGGAWKVAYADFVTAMMAFFLLMWLLNATTEEQRRGLADYFAPTNLLARSVSGSGQPFGGRTPNDEGNVTSTSSSVRSEDGKNCRGTNCMAKTETPNIATVKAMVAHLNRIAVVRKRV